MCFVFKVRLCLYVLYIACVTRQPLHRELRDSAMNREKDRRIGACCRPFHFYIDVIGQTFLFQVDYFEIIILLPIGIFFNYKQCITSKFKFNANSDFFAYVVPI